MSLEYIRKTYEVPARKGVEVKYMGGAKAIFGTIIDSQNAYIRVKLKETKKKYRFILRGKLNI